MKEVEEVQWCICLIGQLDGEQGCYELVVGPVNWVFVELEKWRGREVNESIIELKIEVFWFVRMLFNSRKSILYNEKSKLLDLLSKSSWGYM